MAERGLFSNGVLLVSSNQMLLVFLLALVPLLLGTAAVGGLVFYSPCLFGCLPVYLLKSCCWLGCCSASVACMLDSGLFLVAGVVIAGLGGLTLVFTLNYVSPFHAVSNILLWCWWSGV